MTHHSNPGPHLDADELNAFAEGVLPEHERHHALAHLAECADCRQIIFLAQEPLPAPVTEPAPEPFWHRWFGPIALAGALAAAVLLVVLSLHQHHPATPSEAVNRPPQQPIAPPAPEPKPPQPAAKLPPPPLQNPRSHQAPAATDSTEVASQAIAPAPPVPAADAENRPRAYKTATAQPIQGNAPAGLPQSSSMAAKTQAPMAAPSQQADLARNNQYLVNQQTLNGTAAGMAQNNAAPITKKTPPLGSAQTAAAAPLTLQMKDKLPAADAFSAINGSVTDASGATIPGATITLRQLPGSATTQTATNAAGQFTIPTLPAGRYEMQITSPGFQSLTHQIELKPHDLAQLDSKLTIGASSEAVTVEASRGQIDTQSAETNDLLADRDVALRGKRKPIITVTSGSTVLTLDAAGKLHIRTGNGRFKTVHVQWPGKVAQLSLTPTSSPNASSTSLAAPLPPFAPPPPVFRLTTDSGSVWVSNDGEHWRPL